jgi:hypothetical protein
MRFEACSSCESIGDVGTLGEGGEGGKGGESGSFEVVEICVSDSVLWMRSSSFPSEPRLVSFDLVFRPNLFLPHLAKDEALDILSGDVCTSPSGTVPRLGLGDMIRLRLLSLT